MSRIRAAVTGATTIAAIAAFTVVPAGAAQAAESHTTEPICASTGLIPTELVGDSVSLPLFDPDLGTLTGATFALHASAESSITLNLKPMATSASSLTATTSVDFTMDSSLPAVKAILSNGAATMTATSPTLQPGDSWTSGPISWHSQEPPVAVTPVDSMVGPGTFTVSATTISGLSRVMGGGGNALAGNTTNAGFEACVTYTYEVVPVIDPTDDPTEEPTTPAATTPAATTPAATTAAPALAYTGTERSGPLAALGAGLLLLGSSVIVLARRRRGQHS